LAMSSDNASSAVTYTSISSDSNGPSWGIPLVNDGKLLEMDPYTEVAQQGQAPPLLPAYIPDPMELDEHVPIYVLEPENQEYHVPLNDDIQVEDQPYADDASPTAESPGYFADSNSIEEDTNEDFIDYPDEPEDGKEDDDEDPSEEHEPEDDDEDPSEEHEPEDEDTKEEEPSKGSDETGPFEKDETAVTPPPPKHRGARIFVRPQIPMAASIQALIDAFIAGSPSFPLPPTSPAYDQAPLGHRAAMIPESFATAARTPRGQYDFVDTVEAGHGLIHSPGHDSRTIARAADKAEDAQVCRREGKDFYTQLLDARTDHRDIRLEIDVVRGQRTAYETELHESAKDLAVRQMMCTQVLEARARIDTMEDAGSSY
ncbi:hypothetical protein Tco_0413425, partial [Tanacetum coccineum]